MAAILAAALPFLGTTAIPLLKAGGMWAAAGAMGYWATTNIAQTAQISGDQETQLEWAREKFYTELEHDELEYERDLSKIYTVEAFDQLGDYRQMMMQGQRLQSQANVESFRAEEDQYERNLYLEERAFQGSTGQSLTDLLGTENNLGKLIFIRDELKQMLPNAALNQIQMNQMDYNDHYENPEDHWPL